MLIDSHCHLEPADFRSPEGEDERPAVLARAAAAGVVQLIVVGSGRGLGEPEGSVGLARAHAQLFATVGVHPHDACAVIAGRPPQQGGPAGEELWSAVCALAADPRVVGVGETGLDFHYDHSTPDEQRALMRRTLALARASGKPVSLHVREAHEEARQIVREAGDLPGGVVHCFTGGPEDARAWLALGFHVSLSGIVTFKSAAAIQEAARLVPADRLLLETDCPYLAPVPLRGKRNEPANLVHTAAFVARLRGAPVEELAAQSAAATRALFGLPSLRP
jgi:TatD DNase family protein